MRLGLGPVGRGDVVLVPGTDVPVMRFSLPDKVRGYTRKQIAQRQLRDQMGIAAKSVDVRPLTLGGSGSDWTNALVADRALVARWSDQAGRRAAAVIPDYLSLPYAPGVWTIAAGADHIVSRLDLADGFAAETELALLQLLQQFQDRAPKAIYLTGTPSDAVVSAIRAFEVPVFGEAADAQKHGLAQPSAFAHNEISADLRSDPEAERQALQKTLSAWVLPVVLGLVAIAVWTATIMLETRALREQFDTTRRSTEELLRHSFVPAGPILDVRAQVTRAMDSRRAQLAAQSDVRLPLDVMNRASLPLYQSGADLHEISYSADTGLIADVGMRRFADLDQLAAQLRSLDLQVTIIESASEGDGARGRLLIKVTE